MQMDVWRDGWGSPAAPALGTEGIRPPSCMSLPGFWGRGEHPALPRTPRRGWGLQSCSPAASMPASLPRLVSLAGVPLNTAMWVTSGLGPNF